MVKRLDLSGQRFGRWTAVSVAEGVDARSYVRWHCVCDCGEMKLVARTSLVQGESQSCGCLQKEGVRQRRTDHGRSRTDEYLCWRNMWARCRDRKNSGYHNYGGRGISVCPEWKDFAQFLLDMGERPEGMTLERRDNDKGYSKDNCRWATRQEQNLNTRRNRLVTFKGQTLTLTEWAEQLGVGLATLAYRLNHWDLERALSAPLRPWPTSTSKRKTP